MKSADLRKAFIEFFKARGHTHVASSSLVPDNDPTLLFANSGMVQFKDLFLGAEKRAYKRAVTCQKSIRMSGKHNDLENVGVTARHHTFFEMLGNFSFGDYFKKEALTFAWEFVTKTLKIPASRLWVTVLHSDDEAANIWANVCGVAPDRILRMTEKDNFWAMGDTGPCGPCSEIYYYLGDDESKQSEADFRRDDGTYMEIWNNVFMQFERGADGSMKPLPNPSVDTGMGLERTAAVLQGVKSNYDTDILRSLIALCEKLSGLSYDGKDYTPRDLRKDLAYARDVAMRVVADHARTIAFLIAEGISPGSDGRAYVLRRVIRRAVRHARVLEFKEPFLAKACLEVVRLMGDTYPELVERKDLIAKVADAEERGFKETLESGLVVLQKEVEKLKKGQLFPGEAAFLLHDTYGFPLDLTQDALKAYGTSVDEPAFERAMRAQKDRSREDRKAQKISFATVKIEGDKTKFLGYDDLAAEAKLIQIIADGKDRFGSGDMVSLVFEATPFYAESGGQVGDTGLVKFKDAELTVIDTQKVQDKYWVHTCEILRGELNQKIVGEKAKLEVDAGRRTRIRANHSATHLLQSGLRAVLGTHIKQAGSRVDANTLRFDYSHFEAVTPEQLNQVQMFVNDQIRQNHPVVIEQMAIDKAKAKGATALFGEKYGDVVRVVEIGPQSMELCGGTHVQRSGDIGLLLLASEGGISAGVRRIECFAGFGAEAQLLAERDDRRRVQNLIAGDGSSLADQVERIIAQQKNLERELETAKAKLASAVSSDLVKLARTSPKGIKVIAEKVESTDSETLKTMVDRLRQKLGSGVVALASQQDGKGIIIAGVTADLISQINAGTLIKEASKISGGRGGGRADFAQAGGVDPSLMSKALDKLFELVG